jgi:hypothetical protein
LARTLQNKGVKNMQPEIAGAIIGGVATIVAAIIGGWVAIKIKQLELKAKGLTADSQSSNNRLWGIIGALILGGVVFISLTAFGYFPSIFQPSKTNETAIVNSDILLSDSFDNLTYDGKFNTDLWSCFGCDEFGIVTTSQGNGAIRLDATNKSNFENHSGGLVSQLSWLPSEIGYLEAKMKLLSTDNGGMNILLRVPLDGKDEWATTCFIQRFSTAQAEFGCDVFSYINGETKGEYVTKSFPVKYDEWHTAKIELTPNTLELRFYFDGELIGEHIPADANLLKAKYLRASFGIYTDTEITGFINDCVVGKAP